MSFMTGILLVLILELNIMCFITWIYIFLSCFYTRDNKIKENLANTATPELTMSLKLIIKLTFRKINK